MGAAVQSPRRIIAALAPRRARLATALGAVLALSCAEELPGFPPPDDQLHYPVSMAIDGEHLLVVSSNFDQRYNAGSLTALSLPALAALVPEGASEPLVARELPATGRSRLKISSFGGQLVVVPRGTESEVYVATRRGNRVTRATFAGGLLDCGNGDVTERVLGTDCTPARTPETVTDSRLPAEDPFSVTFVPGGSPRGVVVVGALRPLAELIDNVTYPAGVLSLLDPAVMDANLVAERSGGPLAQPMRSVRLVGLSGALSLVPIPGTSRILAAAADGDDISPFGDLANVAQFEVRTTTAGIELSRKPDIGIGQSAGADGTRGVAVASDGERAYVSLRLRQASGTSVVLFNSAVAVVSPSDGRTLSVLEVGEELGVPALLERPTMRPSRLLYVPDLRSDRVYVLDVSNDSPVLVRIIEPRSAPGETRKLMSAPAQILIAPESVRGALGGRTLAFVASFANSTLAVLDLSDPDPRRHRLAARLGRALADDGVDEVE